MSTQNGAKKAMRGRPRDAEKHSAIIVAATQLFLEQGVSGTSMDEVAKKASVSKQTVYSHFSSKELLFAAAIRAAIEEYYPETIWRALDAGSLEEGLRSICDNFVKLLLGEKSLALQRVLAAEAQRGSNFAELFMESGPLEMEARIQSYLRKWVDVGSLIIEDVEEATNVLIMLLKGKVHFMHTIGLISEITDDMRKSTVDCAIKCFFKLYRAE